MQGQFPQTTGTVTGRARGESRAVPLVEEEEEKEEKGIRWVNTSAEVVAAGQRAQDLFLASSPQPSCAPVE